MIGVHILYLNLKHEDPRIPTVVVTSSQRLDGLRHYADVVPTAGSVILIMRLGHQEALASGC